MEIYAFCFWQLRPPAKVIIYQLHGKASLVEQDTNLNVFLAYLKFILGFWSKEEIQIAAFMVFSHLFYFFSEVTTIFKKEIQKTFVHKNIKITALKSRE